MRTERPLTSPAAGAQDDRPAGRRSRRPGPTPPGGKVERARDDLAVEEPLEIRVSRVGPAEPRVSEPLAVTMRTPGDDFDLVAGFLHGEGIVASADALRELTYCRGDAGGGAGVQRRRGATGARGALRRGRAPAQRSHLVELWRVRQGVPGVGGGDGDAVPVRKSTCRDRGGVVASLPERLREGQGVFARTGGLHAAGLFDSGGGVRGPPGGRGAPQRGGQGRGPRVSSVDALPASDGILVVSGRASFEIVQKAVAAGVPVVVAVGAPSSLAVDLAARFGVTLVGFARDGGFNVYTGAERVV